MERFNIFFSGWPKQKFDFIEIRKVLIFAKNFLYNALVIDDNTKRVTSMRCNGE